MHGYMSQRPAVVVLATPHFCTSCTRGAQEGTTSPYATTRCTSTPGSARRGGWGQGDLHVSAEVHGTSLYSILVHSEHFSERSYL
jgi:hypothetical protein